MKELFDSGIEGCRQQCFKAEGTVLYRAQGAVGYYDQFMRNIKDLADDAKQEAEGRFDEKYESKDKEDREGFLKWLKGEVDE